MPPSRPTNQPGLVVARIAGISITLDSTWFISLALMSWLSHGLIVVHLVRDPDAGVARLALSVAFGLAISACIVVHELSHALVARAYGMRVRRITLFMFGGVAQIEHEAPHPKAEFAVALAGPLASLLLASAFAGIAAATGRALGENPGTWGIMALLNVVVAVFNLAPAFPMDGGRLLRSLLWSLMRQRSRATRYAVGAGRVFAAMLVVWGVVIVGQSSFEDLSGLYTAMIGVFLYNAAGSAGRIEGGDRPNHPTLRLPGVSVEEEEANSLTGRPRG